MYEKEEIVALVAACEEELRPLYINGAMSEIANPEGTLANAKFWTGQSSGSRTLAQRIIAKLRENTDDR